MTNRDLYTHIIPIGSNCRIGIALRELGIREEAMPLDWCLSSMKSVNSLFKEDFEGLASSEFCSQETFIMPNGVNHKYILNHKYNLNITHEESINDNFINRYKKRADRTMSILNNPDNKVLFVRNSLDGIIHDPLHRYYLETEYKNPSEDSDPTLIEEFCDIIEKKYPNLKFSVLVINHRDPLSFDSDLIFNITSKFNQEDKLWDQEACLYHLKSFMLCAPN